MFCFCFGLWPFFVVLDVADGLFVGHWVGGTTFGHKVGGTTQEGLRWKPPFSVGHWAGGARVHGALMQKPLINFGRIRSLGRGNHRPWRAWWCIIRNTIRTHCIYIILYKYIYIYIYVYIYLFI